MLSWMSGSIMMSLCLCSMLSLPLMVQPLSLGMMIMVSTCFMCCLLALTLSSWYGYILFLIYVGGLLVMFAYVAALTPNILFGSMPPLPLVGLIFLTLISIFYIQPFVDPPLLSDFSSYTSMISMKTYGGELASLDNVYILVGLAIILLFNLVAVVKVCRYQKSPLRPFLN